MEIENISAVELESSHDALEKHAVSMAYGMNFTGAPEYSKQNNSWFAYMEVDNKDYKPSNRTSRSKFSLYLQKDGGLSTDCANGHFETKETLERAIDKYNKLIAEVLHGKFEFLSACDKFRMNYENGEELWLEMMENSFATEDSVIDSLDASKFLDDGEDFNTYIKENRESDIESAFYESKMGGKKCVFFQTAGFEFIFMDKNDFPEKLDRSEQGIEDEVSQFANEKLSDRAPSGLK